MKLLRSETLLLLLLFLLLLKLKRVISLHVLALT